jgi:isoaspartyl peptidase/L-asparaginase-like protein (Ntn-hydrolase superfamily)
MHDAHLQGVEAAVRKGFDLLRQGANAVETVRSVIQVLENDPTFDAGQGSFLNRAGEVEMDAIIMDGRDLSVGAVAAIQHVAHPVLAADLVRRYSEHVLLAKTVVDAMAEVGVRTAARRGVKTLKEKVGGLGGIICMNRQGQTAYDYNTPFMARATATQKGIGHVGI